MDRINNNFYKFAIWMGLYLFAYMTVALAIRYLSKVFNIIEIVGIRSAGSVIVAIIAVAMSSKNASFNAKYTVQDIIRSVLHLIGSLAFVWSLINIPIALVSIIEFIGPIFAVVIGVMFLKNNKKSYSRNGIFLIATGVATALYTNSALDYGFVLWVAIGAVFLLTVTNIMLVEIAKTQTSSSIILKMHAIQFPIYVLLLFYVNPIWPQTLIEGSDVWGLSIWLGIASASVALVLAGYVTQASLASASRYGTPLQLCAADVLRLPLMAAVGYIVFSEAIGFTLLLPGALIMIGSIMMSLPARQDASGA